MTVNTTAAVGNVDIPIVKPKKKFAGEDVFEVSSDVFDKFNFGKKPYARWKKYMDMDDPLAQGIREFCYKNSKKSVILQDKSTKAMIYLRRK